MYKLFLGLDTLSRGTTSQPM